MNSSIFKRLQALEEKLRERPIFFNFTDVRGNRRKVTLSELIGLGHRQERFLCRALNGLETDTQHADFSMSLATVYDLRHKLLDAIVDTTNRPLSRMLWYCYRLLEYISVGFRIDDDRRGIKYIFCLDGDTAKIHDNGTVEIVRYCGKRERVDFGES